MPEPRVTLDPSMAHHFRLEAWDAMDDGGRLALGDYLTERLQAHGWDVPEPMTLGTFGPPDSPRSVLQWREPASGMTFSLVPGGTFRPGYDEDRLELLAELRRWESDDWDDEDEDEEEASSPAQFLRKGPVEVPPSFLATELIRPTLPGLRSVVKPKGRFFAGQPYSYNFLGDAVLFDWDQVGPVLDHYGWILPTSAGFEWALRGGSDTLFYWGDDLPAFMSMSKDDDGYWRAFGEVMSASFAPGRPRSWPWCNAFGLAAMLPIQTWCASRDASGAASRSLRGGAAYCYPWQGCGEWELLLSAGKDRSDEMAVVTRPGAIRPAIELAAGA